MLKFGDLYLFYGNPLINVGYHNYSYHKGKYKLGNGVWHMGT